MESKKGQMAIIDVTSMPEGLDAENFVRIMKQQKIIFYDSSNGGHAPQVINVEEGKELHIVDYSTEEGKEIFNRLSK